MFNVLLDKFPEEYNGYRIDSDFQTGIQITQCLEDAELSEYERIVVACELLYLDFPPTIEECVDGLTWFLNGWNHDKHKQSKTDTKIMDFDMDQWRIFAAFKSQYGIDLNVEKLHWFLFMGLLSNLEECSFTRILGIRQQKLTGKMSSEERRTLKEAKAIYAIKNEEPLSEQEKAAIAEFMKYARIEEKAR